MRLRTLYSLSKVPRAGWAGGACCEDLRNRTAEAWSGEGRSRGGREGHREADSLRAISPGRAAAGGGHGRLAEGERAF